MNNSNRVNLSVVVPCYNEESLIEEFLIRMAKVCRDVVGESYEIVMVNDGSTDKTGKIIQAQVATNLNIVGIDLMRNHGHQIAVSAGLDFARGERILIIDADLQDPPELLPEFMQLMDQGYDVVYGERRTRSGENRFKLVTANLFYRLLNKLSNTRIPLDAGDFRLINRKVLEVLKEMPEQSRFLRGMIAWVGGKQTSLIYDRAPRHSGSSKYPLRKMVVLAIDAITGFSVVPLRLISLGALACILISLALGIYVAYSYFFLDAVRGWASMGAIILFFSSFQLFALSVIGEYLGRVYIETKRRPTYIVRSVWGSASTSD